MLVATPSVLPSSRFLFSQNGQKSMFMVLYVSAASRFECVTMLDLYFCYSWFVFFWVSANFFLDRWDSQDPPYVIISDLPWCVYYCSKDISLYYLYFVYMAHFYIFLIYFLCLIWIFGLLANAFVSLFSVFFLLLIWCVVSMWVVYLSGVLGIWHALRYMRAVQ